MQRRKDRTTLRLRFSLLSPSTGFLKLETSGVQEFPDPGPITSAYPNHLTIGQ